MHSIIQQTLKKTEFLHPLRHLTWLVLFVLISSCNTPASKPYKELFVAKTGNDAHDGSEDQPFLTISKAAQVAMPGDIITVKEGIYREAIIPARGGTSEDNRITYRAAKGEDVRILGSERASGWTVVEDGIWKVELDSSFFGAFNPFNTLTRHPVHVAIDESGDGWGWLKYGRWTHLGDVIIDGEGLTERQTQEELTANSLTWYTETKDDTTAIWANFGNKDPNRSEVEVNSRPFAFNPKEAGLSYITLKGFTIMNVANHWAPPTVYQPGAIWTNGGHHWIIEDNVILYAQGAAISLGIPNGDADLSQSGSHIIRNNVIMRCGQGGTTGQSWNSNSEIYGNHIEDINYRKEFGGWETAAIKHHNTNNLSVRNNFIRGVYTISPDTGAAHGIWNDFQNRDWRVSNNIIMNTDAHAIVTEAIWEGANLYDNNIIVDGSIGSYSVRGDAWVHNLLVRSAYIWENQPWGDRPSLGNIRWLNNLFVDEGLDPSIEADDIRYAHNAFLGAAPVHPHDANAIASDILPQLELRENEKGISLVITMDEKVIEKNYPVVRTSSLDLDFGVDATVGVDFFGKERTQNLAGPFASLKPGKNELMIYPYPELYKKATGIVGNRQTIK